MEQHPNYAAESAHLAQTLLERHRHSVTQQREGRAGGAGAGAGANANWAARKDFTVEVGRRQIGEFIRSWGLRPCWLHGLDFTYKTEEDHFTLYHYRARFSTPTPQKPIQGTASVYFVVGASKVTPGTLPVEVLFVVESNRVVHTPGRGTFTEKWLADVIESKALLRSAVDL